MPPCTCTPSEATSTPISVENALATGVSSEARACAACACGLVGAALGAVERHRGRVADGARRLGERAHAHQHALDVGMGDDRRRLGRRHSRRAALAALARIGERLLGGAFGDADALQADRQPRPVHHGEHAGHAGILFADDEAGGAAVVAEDHRAGRRAVDAELVLDRMRAHVVAGAGRAVGVEQKFGHQEQRDAARAGRRVGQTREHEMDDVVGEVVLAVGDEDLLAGDAIGAVAARSARVRNAPTSEPACGSVSCIVPIHSPETSLPR